MRWSANTPVEPHELAVAQHVDETSRWRAAPAERPAPPTAEPNRTAAGTAVKPEDAIHADGGVEATVPPPSKREHQADRGPIIAADLGAVLVAGEVGGERGNRSGDRPRTRHAADDDHVDAVGERRDHAAEHEQHQAEDDHRLAAEAVGGGAVGDLQAGLGEAVGADRQARKGEVAAPGMVAACTANTGRIRNRPSMRREIAARPMPARRSSARHGKVACGNGHTEEPASRRPRFYHPARICADRLAAASRRILGSSPFLLAAMDQIRIRGARTHNLRNVSLDLPRNRLTVITGLSGSVKSSLAFDTPVRRGQRRYVGRCRPTARQFLQLMGSPTST